MKTYRRLAAVASIALAAWAAAPAVNADADAASVAAPATTEAASPTTSLVPSTASTPATTEARVPAATPTTSPTTAATTTPTTGVTVRPTTGPGAVVATSQPDRRYDRNDRYSSRRTSDADRSLAARTIAGAKPFPAEYDLVLKRSIFIKGRQETAFGGLPVSTTSTTGEAPAAPVFGRPESRLVFEGVTDVDGTTVAFVEDTSQNKVLQLKLGDKVASGSVTAIAFDAIQYSANGKDTRVSIGYNFEGFPAMVATSQPSGPLFGSSGGPGPFGQPGGYNSNGSNGGGGGYRDRYGNSGGSSYRPPMGNSQPPPSSSGSTGGGGDVNDILAKLRAKRAAEMGGK